MSSFQNTSSHWQAFKLKVFYLDVFAIVMLKVLDSGFSLPDKSCSSCHGKPLITDGLLINSHNQWGKIIKTIAKPAMNKTLDSEHLTHQSTCDAKQSLKIKKVLRFKNNIN